MPLEILKYMKLDFWYLNETKENVYKRIKGVAVHAIGILCQEVSWGLDHVDDSGRSPERKVPTYGDRFLSWCTVYMYVICCIFN